MPDSISQTENIIRQHISEQNTIFVFPTKIAADSWAERMLEYVPAVAMERFTEWDTFKGEAVRSRQQDKRSIPSVLRKIFAQHLIERNKNCTEKGDPLFRSIINPVHATESASFANWIASLLAPLNTWKRTFEAALHSGTIVEDETDRDLRTLHNEYKHFLDEHNLFDPAWEEPPFNDNGFEYVLFYPDILSDFCEYERLLRASNHVTIVPVQPEEGEELPQPECILYTNSRTELRETALFIRELVAQQKCGYDEIVISVPDLDNWGAYILRELSLYCIPTTLRSGKCLSAYGAGMLFSQIQQCVSTGFSFVAVKELLLNKHLPWKDPVANDLLIQFGIDNSCLCSYEDKGVTVDVWQAAFKANPKSEREQQLYTTLKRHCNAMSQAASFTQLQSAYFQFRAALFDENRFSEESNLILGRCLTELANLIDIEESFPDVPVQNHFSFFSTTLSEKEYLAQNKTRGVSVVPYKLAATAPAYCHIIPGASQDSLTVMYKQLGFLPQPKRAGLSLSETDPSSTFIELYRRHSRHNVRFTCSEKSFSGYSIPHSVFRVEKNDKGIPDSLEQCHRQDFLSAELLSLKGTTPDSSGLLKVSPLQATGFNIWSENATRSTPERQLSAKTEDIAPKDPADVSVCAEQIRAATMAKDGSGRISVSQTALNDFFSCPRKWLYKRVLKLKEPDVQVLLMRDQWIGIIYHDIINGYLAPYRDTGNPIEPPETSGSTGQAQLSHENRLHLRQTTHSVVENYYASPITHQLLLVQEKAILSTAEHFLVFFTKQFAGHRVVALEKELSCKPNFSSVGISPEQVASTEEQVVYTGRIDCVLSESPEEFIILDFKTGKTPTKKSCYTDKPGQECDFQMPMYVTLLEANGISESVTKAAFMSIQEASITPIIGNFGTKKAPPRTSQDDNGFDPVLDRFNAKAFEYVHAIQTLRFTQIHDVPYVTCSKCEWKAMCRRTYTVSGESI